MKLFRLPVVLVFLSVFLFATSVEAKLLDKIAAIVDDNIITLSQINRVAKNLAIKKNVAPMIYDKATFNNDELLNISINKYLIRAKLTELGYTITDDQVEAQIKSNEKRLNVDRKSLMNFLKEQGSTFDEYFETLREAIEQSYFINRVVSINISVSEQDVKNTYFKNNIKDSRLNFKYTLIDYVISKEIHPKLGKDQMEDVVKQYRINSILPEAFSELTSSNLDEITEEGIAPELKNLLKHTDEGAISSVILLNGQHHVFYVVKKDLVESEAFSKQKDSIRESLFEAAVKAEAQLWFERERNKHYIKISL
jgi:peptidyl-prolyl cis-trans isomerase SurA